MTNSVLCAVDVSNGDDDIKAIRKAAQLAALDNAQLDVIAVVPDFGMSQVSSFFSKDHHEKNGGRSKGTPQRAGDQSLGRRSKRQSAPCHRNGPRL